MYSKGRSAVTPMVVVYCRKNGRDHNRLGVTVSTKLGTAVVRNRARRRLREVYRLYLPQISAGYDLVLVARNRAFDAPFPRSWQPPFSAVAGSWGLLGEEASRAF